VNADLNDWGGRLGALADFEPPAENWQAVLAARAARESQSVRRWPVVLAAATLAVTVALAAWLQSAQRELAAGTARPATALAVAAGARAESERLERLLARLPERRAMRGSTAFTVAELEDRLALLDDRLSRVSLEPNAPERAERLWRERVDVLHSLVQVRYADAVGIY
jgi:hypothetical protein